MYSHKKGGVHILILDDLEASQVESSPAGTTVMAYRKKGNILYIVGEQRQHWRLIESGENAGKYRASHRLAGESTRLYENKSEIPDKFRGGIKFTVINYETGEWERFQNQTDIPEKYERGFKGLYPRRKYLYPYSPEEPAFTVPAR